MNKEKYEALGRERLITGTDLFSYENIVVPVKTKGRWYGSISQTAVKRGWEIPNLEALTVSAISQEPRHFVVYVAFWDDYMFYRATHIRDCVISVVARAGTNGKGNGDVLAIPLLGGRDKFEFLGAMELGVLQAQDNLDAMGFPVPEVQFVIKKKYYAVD